MKTLEFDVVQQSVTRIGDLSKIIRGSKGYLECLFNFDETWTGYKVIAMFESKNNTEVAIVENSICRVPDSMTDEDHFCMKLLGIKTIDNYTYTNKILIEQED